ncbi:anaerobic ribonucleoside-triphosphate reductase [Dethiobacter alkaliphilus]|uniref:Anaerobic ribonucleoside-triphosphate reductase n=1 Tax=Dethiobacter alkaliphilus AHT 1 TaxID=555088 RepID=C0GFS0_DETAL|nr:anaerobic ribonucleoside-triphosphate reductase [Dethiobacter alkaliphilus]EEG77609.1 anaerobic ribonucleoside-triphosphate reductase [Dethiobacter alkaliphilus AHT 1]
MFIEIKKRDGRVVPFDAEKITDAILKAAKAVGGENKKIAVSLTNQVVSELTKMGYNGIIPAVEDVQDTVEKVLIENGHARTAKAYILYRHRRSRIREGKSDLMDSVKDILVETSRENANVSNSPSAKMLQIASAASKRYYLTNLLPEDFAQAHTSGAFHIHDLDYYGKTLNCLQIDLTRMLTEGFNTGYGFIRPPKRVASAAAQAAIILQSNQNDMFGGQSFPHFDRSMSDIIATMPSEPSEEEVFQAMEGLVYNLNTMHSRAGAQVPFSSLNVGTDTSKMGRAVTRSILRAFERGLGNGESPIFPNLVFRTKKGVNLEPGDPNYDLFQHALKVAAKRLNPTFSFMDTTFNSKFGDEVAYMGCRTRVIANRHGEEVSVGRGNIAPVSLNLPRLALQTRDVNLFFVELDRLLRLSARQLLHRFEILGNLRVRDLPFLMGQKLYMGSAELAPDDTIKEAIKNGTLTVGFIGLAETLQTLIGKHHGEDREAQELGLKIVSHMAKRMEQFSDEFDLNFTLVATPAEGLSGRFIRMDRDIYGAIPNVTDKEYYTNSVHVPVNYRMSLAEKLAVEGEYHKYCNAGHIAYVELESPPGENFEAVEEIVRIMSDSDVGYGGINYPIDECRSCGYSGIMHDCCPGCGGVDVRRIRRITGYLSTEERFNGAKQAELRDRKPHC